VELESEERGQEDKEVLDVLVGAGEFNDIFEHKETVSVQGVPVWGNTSFPGVFAAAISGCWDEIATNLSDARNDDFSRIFHPSECLLFYRTICRATSSHFPDT
jgi:hypothetical protein